MVTTVSSGAVYDCLFVFIATMLSIMVSACLFSYIERHLELELVFAVALRTRRTAQLGK